MCKKCTHPSYSYAEQEQAPPVPHPLPQLEPLEAKNGLLTGTLTPSETDLPINKLTSSSKILQLVFRNF